MFTRIQIIHSVLVNNEATITFTANKLMGRLFKPDILLNKKIVNISRDTDGTFSKQVVSVFFRSTKRSLRRETLVLFESSQ